VQVGCNAPITNLDARTRYLQNITDIHADQSTKKRATIPQPRFACVEPPYLETTRFQKCVYIQDVLFSVTEGIV
jgi:hypothetical protein